MVRPVRISTAMALLAACFCFVTVPSARASFGVVPGSFTTKAVERDGTVDASAGSHPYEYDIAFDFNKNAQGELEGWARDILLNLPPGLVGDPRAVPRCPRQDFSALAAYCPGDTQVGEVRAEFGSSLAEVPLFNLEPPTGVAASVGANAAGFFAIADASVRTGAGYGVVASTNNIPVEDIRSVEVKIWGVPADSGHNPERQCVTEEKGVRTTKAVFRGCSSDVAPRPFLTLPTSCGGPLLTTLEADAAQAPGEFVSAEAQSLDAGGNPVGLFGCEALSFDPSFALAPEVTGAEEPSGLNAELRLPQPESPEGHAESALAEAEVTLPEGMTVSPSAANGLTACPLEGPEGINLSSSEPAKCPGSSKVGTVEIRTPLLEEELEGSVFVAQQGNLPGHGSNPFGSLLAIYVVAEGDGVVAKIPGEIKLESTGRLIARFGRDPTTGEEHLPEVPFSDLRMGFFGGARAALIAPSSCGTYETTARLTPWSGNPPVESRSYFTIDHGCAHGFSPAFTAGAKNAQAGAYAPLVVSFSRRDGEQRFSGVQVTEPPGLLATIKNAELCPEPQASEGECPAGSLIGETTAAAGPGEDPYWTRGKVYLTGPYRGAPFGLSVVIPAEAGPFNIGERGGMPDGKPIVTRARIDIDPSTAQAIVTSDPLPTALQNIPLDVRTVNVLVNSPNFTFNPTNCAPLSVTGTISSTAGASVGVSSPFEATNCATLPFKPSFTVSTQAKTSKANGASLTVHVTQKHGEADVQKVDLQIPLTLPARLTTLQKACTEKQFDANPAGCPEASVIGSATARTPVLGVPVTGPAYLVSHGGAAFPDVEFVLQADERGGVVEIVLDGKTDIKKGITYSRFETLPDAPIESFEAVLPEGPHSALTTAEPGHTDLCAPTKTETVAKRVTVRVGGNVKHVTRHVKKQVTEPLTIPTTITGQNGAVVTQNTKVTVTGCPKVKRAGKGSHTGRKRKH